MNQTLRERYPNWPGVMLRHVVLVSLCLPLYTSIYGSNYSPDFMLVSVFVFLFAAGSLLQGRIPLRQKNVFCLILLVLWCGMNARAFHFNRTMHQYYAGQFNLALAFLFFILLCAFPKDAPAEDEGLVRLILRIAVLSNLIAPFLRLAGFSGFYMGDGLIHLIPMRDNGFHWLYLHKSQYSFSLLLFISLSVVYRRLFKNNRTYYGSLAVFLLGLVISDVFTAMGACILIFVGLLADFLRRKYPRFRLKNLLWFLPVLVVGAGLFLVILRNRPVMSLNNRIPIWATVFQFLRDNPEGVGRMAGLFNFRDWGYSAYAYNCHSVLLNWMFQFSVPAGALCIAMLLCIAVVSIKRNLSFTTLGIWAAIFITMNMDWCVLATELPMTLLVIYLLFFSPRRKALAPEADASA